MRRLVIGALIIACLLTGQTNQSNRAAAVRITNGSTDVTVTGTSIDVNCTGGCGSPSQAQTYFASRSSTASAASQDYLTVFNASGSGKILRIQRITLASGNTAAVAGVAVAMEYHRVSTAGTTCTAVTIRLADSTNTAVPAQVTSTSVCTTDPTSTFVFGGCSLNTDETSPSPMVNCYLFPGVGGQPITLREGEGIMLKNTALAPVGLLTPTIEFTM